MAITRPMMSQGNVRPAAPRPAAPRPAAPRPAAPRPAVAENAVSAGSAGGSAIASFELALMAKDRDSVLDRKKFAVRAAEFLCEIVRTGAATAEDIARSEPDRMAEILKNLPKDSAARKVLASESAVPAAETWGVGEKFFPSSGKWNADRMLKVSVLNQETGRIDHETRSDKTWKKLLALVDANRSVIESFIG